MIQLLLLLILVSTITSEYLYLTFHGGSHGINNIHAYDIDTFNYIGKVLVNNQINGARGMVMTSNNIMYVADASDKDSNDSSIMVYDKCSATNFHRNYMFKFSYNIDHPYGMAYGKYQQQEAIFVSSQDTQEVTAYTLNGTYLGLIYNFGEDNIRGLSYNSVLDVLFIADETTNTVYAYSFQTSGFLDNLALSVDDPIKVYDNGQYIFVGSGDKTQNSFNSYDYKGNTVQAFTSDDLSHAAGITSIGDRLFVVSQNNLEVLEFSISTGEYKGIVISNLSDSPEQIHISSC